MTRPLDLRLYLVAGPGDCPGLPLRDVVAAAARGGAGLVQLRHKDADTRELLQEARALKALLDPLGVPLVINDDVEAALASGATGVHLGQGDMDPREARALLGPKAVIGWTVKTVDQACLAESMNAASPGTVDYLGAGPVYASATKPDAGEVLGLDGLGRICAATSLPVVGIGGIGPGRAGPVVQAGARGVAVVAAICAAHDPEAAARALRAEIEAAQGRAPA